MNADARPSVLRASGTSASAGSAAPTTGSDSNGANRNGREPLPLPEGFLGPFPAVLHPQRATAEAKTRPVRPPSTAAPVHRQQQTPSAPAQSNERNRTGPGPPPGRAGFRNT